MNIYYIVDGWKPHGMVTRISNVTQLSTHDEDVAILTAYSRWVGMNSSDVKKRTDFYLAALDECLANKIKDPSLEWKIIKRWK